LKYKVIKLILEKWLPEANYEKFYNIQQHHQSLRWRWMQGLKID